MIRSEKLESFTGQRANHETVGYRCWVDSRCEIRHMDLINHGLRFLFAQLSLKPRIVHLSETHTVMQNNVEEKQSIQMWLSSS